MVLLAACDAPPSASSPAPPSNPLAHVHMGDIAMFVDGDEQVPLCEGGMDGLLQQGSLHAQGTCDSLDLTVIASVDVNGGIAGTVIAEDTHHRTMGAVSGERTEDGISLIWSLEIPLPDDPPLDDDIWMLATTGEAWLVREPN